MKAKTVLSAALLGIAGAALAHTGVENATVMARMEAMKAIGEATKTLGQMAKGETVFDAGIAREAASAIADHAARTPGLFEAQEDDPLSEAHPAIWENFADFTAKAGELEAVASGLSVRIASRDDLRGGLRALATACKGCHEEYRE